MASVYPSRMLAFTLILGHLGNVGLVGGFRGGRKRARSGAKKTRRERKGKKRTPAGRDPNINPPGWRGGCFGVGAGREPAGEMKTPPPGGGGGNKRKEPKRVRLYSLNPSPPKTKTKKALAPGPSLASLFGFRVKQGKNCYRKKRKKKKKKLNKGGEVGILKKVA